jgi:hypothetical protein
MVLPAIGTVVLLGAGGVAAAAAITGGGADRPAPQVQATATSLPSATSPSPSGTVTAPSPSPSPSATAPSRPHRPPPALAISTTGTVSWLEVTRPDGRLIFTGMLRHGRSVVVRSGPVHAVIGDAGAVRLARNGKVKEPAGRPHQVLVIDVR